MKCPEKCLARKRQMGLAVNMNSEDLVVVLTVVVVVVVERRRVVAKSC